MKEDVSSAKRGWLFDQLMLIGHYEAELTHDDEETNNLDHDAKNSVNDLKEIERIAEEINFRDKLTEMHYEGRTAAERDIFSAFPELEVDTKKWCDIKHQCAIYTLAAETYHSRHLDPVAKENLLIAGRTLAFLVSWTFGFEPMDCMRCVNDRIANKRNNAVQPEVINPSSDGIVSLSDSGIAPISSNPTI